MKMKIHEIKKMIVTMTQTLKESNEQYQSFINDEVLDEFYSGMICANTKNIELLNILLSQLQ